MDGAPAFDSRRLKQRLGVGRDRIALSLRQAAPRFDRDPAVRSSPDPHGFAVDENLMPSARANVGSVCVPRQRVGTGSR